jgi:hypothetical protein
VESLVERPEADEVRPNAWLRCSRRTFWFVMVALGMAVAFVAMSLSLALGSGSTPGAAIFGLVFAGPCLLFARRIGRAGLWMGPAGLVVRGPLRTWEIPGNAAVSFSPGVQPSYGNGTPCPILKRSDGSTIGVWALGREGLVWRFGTYLEELQPLCDELNFLLEELYPEHPLPRPEMIGR